MKLFAYNSVHLFDREVSNVYPSIKDLPGIKLYGSLFYLFARNLSIVDRSNTIKIPLKTKPFEFLRIPEYNKDIGEFSSIVDNRINQLLSCAETNNRDIVVMWSGGVDSTLILASLIKNASQKQLKRITVLLSKDSILENRNFYERYVINNFNVVASEYFYRYVGSPNHLYITGEGGDQLFASLFIIQAYKDIHGADSVYSPIDEDKLSNFISSKTALSLNDSHKLFTILNRTMSACPTKVDTLYKFFWWVNLSLKWQSVYTRSLLFSNNKNPGMYDLPNNYTTFYHSDEMQQWTFKRINDVGYFTDSPDPKHYKVESKQYIFDLDGDIEYRNEKNKQGSYNKVISNQKTSNFMYDDYTFSEEIKFEDIYEPDNDFV